VAHGRLRRLAVDDEFVVATYEFITLFNYAYVVFSALKSVVEVVSHVA